MKNANNIAEKGYLLAMHERVAYGPGIYSAPDINVALDFAKRFTFENDVYKVVFQNRVNPKTVKRVPPSECGKKGGYYITENENDIRPYGICFVKCKEYVKSRDRLRTPSAEFSDEAENEV